MNVGSLGYRWLKYLLREEAPRESSPGRLIGIRLWVEDSNSARSLFHEILGLPLQNTLAERTTLWLSENIWFALETLAPADSPPAAPLELIFEMSNPEIARSQLPARGYHLVYDNYGEAWIEPAGRLALRILGRTKT